jgi:hypothetical protein
MTEATARTVSNVVLASAGLAAAYVVFTSPPLRRLLLAASQRWLGTSLPDYLTTQLRQAWAESDGPR